MKQSEGEPVSAQQGICREFYDFGLLERVLGGKKALRLGGF
jgi:hypothetical protein